VSQGGYGGAVNVDRTQITLSNCQFTGNRASAPLSEGGAYHQVMGSAVMNQCGFADNWADRLGGAVEFYFYCTAEVSGCTFSDNAAQFGGAIQVAGSYSSCLIHDSAFRRNLGSNINSGGNKTQTTVSSSIVCGATGPAFSGSVTDAGGNCVVESCADTDGNDIPDACQVVSVPGDYGTIQQAIDATPKGDFRIVSVGPGTYAGPIQFNGKAVLVRGAGAGTTILQGTGGARSSVVRFTGGEPATAGIEGMTVRGGLSGTPFPGNPSVLVGGGVFGFNSAASIRDCIVEQNASGFGGGAYLWQCSAQVERTIFRNNSASADGGGLQSFGGSLFMVDSALLNNYANSRGGALHLVLGFPVLTRVAVTNNVSNNVAGGVSWVAQGTDPSRLLLDDCEITGNVANIAEGGIGCVDDGGGATLELRGTRVCTNLPRPNVAGLYIADAASEVCDCIADVTLDGLVNGVDLAALLSSWGSDGGPTPRADCNRDGIVNGSDLGIVLGAWGTCSE